MGRLKETEPAVLIPLCFILHRHHLLVSFTMIFDFWPIALLAVAFVELVSSAATLPACETLQKKFPKEVDLPQSSNYTIQIARES